MSKTNKKYTRTVVGSVIKSNDPSKPNYMKFRLRNGLSKIEITDGTTFSVESKKYQLDSLEKAVTSGKLSENLAEKIKERINKMPDFVLGEIVQVVKN